MPTKHTEGPTKKIIRLSFSKKISDANKAMLLKKAELPLSELERPQMYQMS